MGPPRLSGHWPEYLMEAAQLSLYMMSAGTFRVLFQSPASPVHDWIFSELLRRALIGLAMGLTSVALVYSPWGRRSGAHFNPAITVAYWRLGRVNTADGLFLCFVAIRGGHSRCSVLGSVRRSLSDGAGELVRPLSRGERDLGGPSSQNYLFRSFMSTILFIDPTGKPRRYTDSSPALLSHCS